MVVGLQIASVSRVRNFSGRIVAGPFHNACRAPRNALCDAAASPDVLIRREREEPMRRGKGTRRGRSCRRRRKRRKSRRDGCMRAGARKNERKDPDVVQ